VFGDGDDAWDDFESAAMASAGNDNMKSVTEFKHSTVEDDDEWNKFEDSTTLPTVDDDTIDQNKCDIELPEVRNHEM
jgi:hypothetical protein